MVKQIDIAKRVGLDVSSVNKILCRTPGPVFHKATIAKVFQVAEEMGYNFARDTKHSLRAEKAELKAALNDVYNEWFGLGGRSGLKPETLTTIQKHFEQHKPKRKRSTA